MKRKMKVVWVIHGIVLSVFLAASVLSCGSPAPAPKEAVPAIPQKPAPVAEAQAQAEQAETNMEAALTEQTQAVPEEEIEELAVKYTLAILPFTGGDNEDGETIAELFSFDPTINKVFAPMPRTSINRAIGSEQKFQMGAGMTDPDTIIAIGKQLGAQYIVAGNITSLGQLKLLVISIIRIDKLQQVAGAIQTYIDIEEIQGRLPEMAKTIAQAARIDTSALPRLAIVPFQLRDSTNESDADVLAQILAINITRSGKYAVYPRTTTLEQVQDEYDKQLNGDTADENIVDMGKGENPLFVLSGTARKLGATRNMFNASIINLESGVQVKGASVNYESIDDGINIMGTLAAELTGVNGAAYKYTVMTYPATTTETFLEAIAAINKDATGSYTVIVSGDFEAGSIGFDPNARKIITIRGDGQLHSISNNADSTLFTISDGITLILGNNIRLDGNGKKGTLVSIAKGGTLRMETGATIRGGSGGSRSSASSSTVGGGVYVDGGTFTISGGTISGNRASYGGGVCVNGGTFTMSGGTISGNKASTGGGVQISNGGMFTMSDGIISGNASIILTGGGVYVTSDMFTMSGGTISDNDGGGVYIGGSGGIFTMSGGTISNNGSHYSGGVYAGSGTFTKIGGTIDETNTASSGGRVAYVSDSKKRDTAAGPEVNMDSRVDGSAGGWE